MRASKRWALAASLSTCSRVGGALGVRSVLAPSPRDFSSSPSSSPGGDSPFSYCGRTCCLPPATQGPKVTCGLPVPLTCGLLGRPPLDVCAGTSSLGNSLTLSLRANCGSRMSGIGASIR
eukprot:scaffold287374_cov31-Tisochrysis_lutea.AAC.1